MRNIYSIKDVKADVFGDPIVLSCDAEATRMLVRAAMDENSNIAMFPMDFALYLIGRYERSNGTFIITDEEPRLIMNGEVAKSMVEIKKGMQTND